MPRRSKQRNNEDQFSLALTGEGFQGSTETHGLLSSAYIARHLQQSNEFASLQDVTHAYERTADLWQQHTVAMRRQNEAYYVLNVP